MCLRACMALAGVPATWRQRALAACLIGGPGAVMSHRSAAVLWGVSGFRPGPLEITVPASRSSRHPFALAHRSDVAIRDRTVRDRVPVSRAGRMLVELSGVVSGSALEEAVDDVLCRRLVALDELVRRATGMGNRRGRRALRAVLGAWNAEALPDGVAEMRIVRQLLAAGLPEPVRQHETMSTDGSWPGSIWLTRSGGWPWRSRFPLASRSPAVPQRSHPGQPDRGRGWRLLRAAPEDGADLCHSAVSLLRRAG